MEVQVADAGPCRRSLTITIPPEKIRAHVSDAYRSAAQQVSIKGFRSGKVPRAVLEKKFGAAILQEAKESLINNSIEEACREKEIRVLGGVEFSGVEGPLDQDKPYEFKVELDVRPEISIQRTKGIEATSEPTAVTDEDIEKGLSQLAEQKRTLKAVDEPVEDGDFVKADLVFSKDGEKVHERKNVQLNTNIPVAGTDPEVFKNKLLGAEPGKQVEMPLKFPDNFEKADVRGADGEVKVTVHEVTRVVSPAIDDEFAKGFEFDDLAALKERLSQRIGEEKVQSNKNRIEATILDTLIRENPFDLPGSMVADQKKHLLEQAGQQMKQNGLDDERIKTELEQHDGEAEAEADRRVRLYFILDQIARDEKIFVTEGDIDVELRNIAAANNASPEQARSYFEENHLIGDLRLQLMERKVRDFLRENAAITDK